LLWTTNSLRIRIFFFDCLQQLVVGLRHDLPYTPNSRLIVRRLRSYRFRAASGEMFFRAAISSNDSSSASCQTARLANRNGTDPGLVEDAVHESILKFASATAPRMAPWIALVQPDTERCAENLAIGRPKSVFDRQKVFTLQAEGKSTRQIASLLGISKGSVSNVLATAQKTLAQIQQSDH
jgi:hypothetical protein